MCEFIITVPIVPTYINNWKKSKMKVKTFYYLEQLVVKN